MKLLMPFLQNFVLVNNLLTQGFIMSNEQKIDFFKNVALYQQRVAELKEKVIRLSEKNMDNTIWVLRRWLNNDMKLINPKKELE